MKKSIRIVTLSLVMLVSALAFSQVAIKKANPTSMNSASQKIQVYTDKVVKTDVFHQGSQNKPKMV